MTYLLPEQRDCAHQRQLAFSLKIRTTLIGGEKKMLVWNDLVADEKIRVYDKGVKFPRVIRSANFW